MIEQDGKFMPNFKFRYLFEDVPFGMAVIKGIASLAGVATPKLDMVRKPMASLNKKWSRQIVHGNFKRPLILWNLRPLAALFKISV